VFGRSDIDVGDCVSKFVGLYGGDLTQRVLVLYDVVYNHVASELAGLLSQRGFTGTTVSIVITEWLRDPANAAGEAGREDVNVEENSPLRGRKFTLEEGAKIEDYKVFYIGGENTTLSSIMMRLNKCQVRRPSVGLVPRVKPPADISPPHSSQHMTPSRESPGRSR